MGQQPSSRPLPVGLPSLPTTHKGLDLGDTGASTPLWAGRVQLQEARLRLRLPWGGCLARFLTVPRTLQVVILEGSLWNTLATRVRPGHPVQLGSPSPSSLLDPASSSSFVLGVYPPVRS